MIDLEPPRAGETLSGRKRRRTRSSCPHLCKISTFICIRIQYVIQRSTDRLRKPLMMMMMMIEGL